MRSDWVFEVEDFIKKKEKVVHSQQLHIYLANLDGKQILPKLLQFTGRSEARSKIVTAFRGIFNDNNGVVVQVERKGFPDPVDYSGELLEQIFEVLLGY